MKIEIGESLLQSYLKNVKECILTQTNWKTAASWKTEKYNFEKAEYLFNRFKIITIFLMCLKRVRWNRR